MCYKLDIEHESYPEYIVKFIPYNEFSIENLKNKQVRFSTAFEFNDFNEYHNFIASREISTSKDTKNKIIEGFKSDNPSPETKERTINLMRKMSTYKETYIDTIRNIITQENANDDLAQEGLSVIFTRMR